MRALKHARVVAQGERVHGGYGGRQLLGLEKQQLPVLQEHIQEHTQAASITCLNTHMTHNREHWYIDTMKQKAVAWARSTPVCFLLQAHARMGCVRGI